MEYYAVKKIAFLLIFVLLLSSCALAAGYPKKKLTAVIQWGAGGGTDTITRPLCTLAGDILGKKVVPRNMAGGSGSIGAQYVFDAASNGYTLLMGAENPCLYKALDISGITYEDFTCVLLIGDETVGIAVGAGSPYHSIEELISGALQNPGTVTCATTGVGGMPWEVAAMLTSVTGATFNLIPYDSDASCRTAVLSGECAFTACKIQSGLESWKSGDLNYLCMLSAEEAPLMPGVIPITETYPGFSELLPWGPFYGVFVKNGTDEGIVSTLSDAFLKAFQSEDYQKLLFGLSVNPLGYTGEEAAAYIRSWGEVTVSSLIRCGAIESHE